MSYEKQNFHSGDVLYATQLNAMDDQIAENDRRLSLVGTARYGVSGIGGSAAALTRIYDSVGMTAEVGTDGDNSNVVNDFDTAPPFVRKKCVGYWEKGDDRAIFHVNAYLGEPGYTEDGSMGDYVAVECPKCFYKFENGTLVISSYKYDGFRTFDIFCHGHNQADLLENVYLPAYALALDDNGHAVSLPGLDNCQGDYKTLMDNARTYRDGTLEGLAMLQPAAVNFYEWALFTVEFATQNCQSVMAGCSSLRYDNNDRAVFTDSSHILFKNYNVARVVGEYIAVIPTNVDISSWTATATHKILSIIRCNESGIEDASGTYQLAELEDLGKDYYSYDLTGETEYRIAARPYRTGSCNNVSTPSGSPVNSHDGYHPMKYRYRENVYANQFTTSADMFAERIDEGDENYSLKWFYLEHPEALYPAVNPNAAKLEEDAFKLLDVRTEVEDYHNGYIKSKKHSTKYPDLWIPYEVTGGSASTYFCDYAYLAYSHVVRSVRVGGYWALGATDGFSYCYAFHAPSAASAYYGGSLCMAQ